MVGQPPVAGVDAAKLARVARAVVIAARNVALGANLASLRWIARPGHLLGYANESLFLLKAFGRLRGLEARNVFDVVPGDPCQSITLGALHARGGLYGEPWFHPVASYSADIVSLCLLCRLVAPRTVFEIGTLRGYTAYHLALNTDEACRVYTLDLPPDGSVTPALGTTLMDSGHLPRAEREYCFAGTPVERRITTLFGDSAVFDFGPFEGKVDLFYIDGAHSYDYVRSDTERALACCHPGSVIAWHDYGRVGVNGVSRWLHEFARSHKVYAVPGGSLAFMVVESGAA